MESAGAFTTGTASADPWRATADSAMAVVASALTEAPFGSATEAIQDYRDTLAAVEALLIAQRKKAGHTDRDNEGIIKRSGRVSKAEAKRRTKRADAVEKNPGLASKLTSGELSTEKVDLLADAAAKTDGAAASDAGLIADVTNSNPDQAKAIVRKFVDDHTDDTDRDSRHAWQRRRRRVYKTRTPSGMSALIMEGDDESIDAALRTIRRGADQLYKKDGGRDVPDAKHGRSHDQRMYDAAMAHFDGSTNPATGRPQERPVMVFTGKLSDITDDPDTTVDWECELIGSGRVPRAVAEYYRCTSDHAAQLLSDAGEVLWQGRTKRTVTRGQWLALVVRDAGCVLCAADHTRCEAHHLIPWHAPAKGETNIDQLALVCSDCHHRLHENRQTLFFDAKLRKWRLRRATPDEVAPKRRRDQPAPEKTMASRSSEPSGSSDADSSASVNAIW